MILLAAPEGRASRKKRKQKPISGGKHDQHRARRRKSTAMKRIVLGLGNSMRGDDGVGLVLTKALQERLGDHAEFVCTEEMGFSLLDYLSGYDEAVIIDSIYTRVKEAGELHLFALSEFDQKPGRSNHYVGLPELEVLAKSAGIPFPQKVHLIGVEVEDPFLIQSHLSQDLEHKIPEILERVEKLVASILSFESVTKS